VELITDYLEDALTPAERVRVEDHLSHCGDCAAYLAQMRCLIALARDGEQDVPASTEALPPGMLDALLSELRRART